MDGQTSIFDHLQEAPPPVPPFTVYATASQRWGCGWCGSSSLLGGGAQRLPKYPDISCFWQVCKTCSDKHGWPHLPNLELVIAHDTTNQVEPEPGLKEKVDQIRRTNDRRSDVVEVHQQ